MEVFNVENLPLIEDGMVSKQIDKLFAEAIRDCKSRPGDTKKRVVTVQVEFTPVVQNQEVGGCDLVDVEFGLALKTPSRRTRVYPIALKANGTPYFNPESLGNPRQMTLDEKDGRKLPEDVEHLDDD